MNRSGLLHFSANSPNSEQVINTDISAQEIKLLSVRIQFTNAINATDLKVAYIDIPWLSKLIYDSSNYNNIPIFLNNEAIQVITFDSFIHTDGNIPKSTVMRIVDSDNQNVQNLVKIDVLFQIKN